MGCAWVLLCSAGPMIHFAPMFRSSPATRASMVLGILSVAAAGAFLANWTLAPAFDFDTVLTLLVSLRHGAAPRVMSHAPLLPLLVMPAARVLGPVGALGLLGAVALAATVFLTGRLTYSATGSLPAGIAAPLVLVSFVGFRQVALSLDDNLFPLPFLLGAMLLLLRELKPRTTLVAGALLGGAVALHVPCALALLPAGATLLVQFRGRHQGRLVVAGRFAAGFLGAAACLGVGSYLLASHSPAFLTSRPDTSAGYFANADWFVFAGAGGAMRVVAWAVDAALSQMRHGAPLPGRFAEGGGRWVVLLVLVQWTAMAAVLVAGWRKSRAQGADAAARPALALSLGAAAASLLLALAYEPHNPERIVSGLPFLAAALSVAAWILLRNGVARHPWLQKAVPTALVLLGLLDLGLVGGRVPFGSGVRNLRTVLDGLDPDTEVFIDETVPVMAAYYHRGPTVLVQHRGDSDDCVLASGGTVIGYEPGEPCPVCSLAVDAYTRMRRGEPVPFVSATEPRVLSCPESVRCPAGTHTAVPVRTAQPYVLYDVFCGVEADSALEERQNGAVR